MNLTKYNTVPTNMSDDMGKVVIERVTWRTSAVFSELQMIAECTWCLDSVQVVYTYIHMYLCVHVCIVLANSTAAYIRTYIQ